MVRLIGNYKKNDGNFFLKNFQLIFIFCFIFNFFGCAKDPKFQLMVGQESNSISGVSFKNKKSGNSTVYGKTSSQNYSTVKPYYGVFIPPFAEWGGLKFRFQTTYHRLEEDLDLIHSDTGYWYYGNDEANTANGYNMVGFAKYTYRYDSVDTVFDILNHMDMYGLDIFIRLGLSNYDMSLIGYDYQDHKYILIDEQNKQIGYCSLGLGGTFTLFEHIFWEMEYRLCPEADSEDYEVTVERWNYDYRIAFIIKI
jgi:hypothetical protein